MAHKIYNFQNFVRGLRRDSVTPEDAVNSLYNMTNYKLKYTSGLPRLVVRNGYDVWNSEELPAPCKQLFMWTDQQFNDIYMGICNNKWYYLVKDSTHELIKDETASVPVDSNGGIRNLPTLVVGNRAMFATSSGWYWTDLDTLYGADQCYQVGIDKPTEPPYMRSTTPDGVTASHTEGKALVLTDSTRRKLAFKFQLSQTSKIKNIQVTMQCTPTAQKRSTFTKLSIYTDDGGKPSSTLADTDAISQWRNVNMTPTDAFGWRKYYFTDEFELSSWTTWWGVIEANQEYYDNYVRTGGTADFYIQFGVIDPATPVYGVSYYYDNGAGAWLPDTSEMQFKFSGLAEGRYYDYVMTFYNSTYGIESRPSEFARIKADTEVNLFANYPPRTSNQATQIRLYRRELAETDQYDIADEDVMDTYKFVGEIDYGSVLYDTKATDDLGGELQTFDHYRIGEEDEEEPQRRGAIPVKVACFWKGRVWVAYTNVIYFSKKLEEDGATGLAGDPIPDYFPPENKIETGMPNKIIAMKPLGDDQLVIYFSNSAIWIMMGMDSTLNPPDPSEYKFVEVVTDSGLITSAGLSFIKSRHAMLTRSGIYIFNGTPNYEYIGEGIQSILDSLSDAYLDNSIMVSLADELWLGTDTDGDGYIEDIYIYDLQKNVPYWRKYNYGFNIYDIAVKESGTISSTDYHYKKILASSADDNYIYVLESGFDDNGQAIESVFETHDLRVGRWGLVYGIELMGYYPSEPPSYTVRVTDHIGDYEEFGLEPYNSVDVRGHRSGVRFNSPETMRVRVSQNSITENEVLGFKLSYNQE